jgi:hypothetical protein
MKTLTIILMVLFTLSSCKFSFDKAKVEDSYGSYDGGAGGGSGGGGGGGSPTCGDLTQPAVSLDPLNPYSTLDAPTMSVAADGSTQMTFSITLKNCEGTALESIVPTISVTGIDSPTGTCSATDASGVSSCTITSTYAEAKTISIVTPSEISSLSSVTGTFTKPPLKLNLTACLGGARASNITSFPMGTNLNKPVFSPYNFSAWFNGGNNAVMNTTPVATEVDWVLVQLYSNGDEFNPMSATPLVAKAAVIHSDGTITDPGAAIGSGITFDSFTAILEDYNAGYYLNIVHRNHLPIALKDPILRPTPAPPSPIPVTHPLDININLTTSDILGGQGVVSENPYLLVGTDKCLRPGNYNQDFVIDSMDRTEVVSDLLTMTTIDAETNLVIINDTYLNTDINLDGDTILRFSPVSIDAQEMLNNYMGGGPKYIWGSGAP